MCSSAAKCLFIGIGVLCLSLTRMGATIDIDTAVGVWLFDETRGEDAEDISGLENHGLLFGNASFDKGQFGNAVRLDGSEDFVDCGDEDSLEIHDSSVTISMWIHPDDLRSARFYWKNDGTAPPFRGTYAATWDWKGINFGFGDGGQSVEPIVDYEGLSEWYHLAVVRDRDTAKVLWYINGELAKDMDDPTEDVAFNANLILGCRPGTAECFAGLIDDVAIFKSVLTEKEVGVIMEFGLERAMAGAVSPAGKAAEVWGLIKVDSRG